VSQMKVRAVAGSLRCGATSPDDVLRIGAVIRMASSW
jgi:hypothetical protein